MTRTLLLLLCLVVALGIESAGAAAPPLFPEGGGSNLVFQELGAYAQHPTGENWEKDVKVTLLHYHEHVDAVRQRLKAMRDRGQTKIGLMLWYVQDGDICTSHAHVICPKDGQIPAQVEDNIRNILKDIAAAGFDTVVMRMAPQGAADPLAENYQPARAADSWKLFEHLHAICAAGIEGTKVHMLYDLGAETMGHPYSGRPGAQVFLKLLWGNYIAKYPPGEAVGFTLNHAFEPATTESLKVFADSGVWPAAVAIDVYDDPAKYLGNLSKALASFGKADFPVIICETYRNNAEMAAALAESKRTLGLNFRFLLQWPLDRGAAGHSNNPVSNEIDAYAH